MTARQPLYDVTLTLGIASLRDADELVRILDRADRPPIIAVMCDVRPDGTRWSIAASIGVRAPSNLAAAILAARYVRRACKRLGFEPHMTGVIAVAPSRLGDYPGDAAERPG